MLPVQLKTHCGITVISHLFIIFFKYAVMYESVQMWNSFKTSQVHFCKPCLNV